MNSQKFSPAAGNSAGDYSLYFVPDRLSLHLKSTINRVVRQTIVHQTVVHEKTIVHQTIVHQHFSEKPIVHILKTIVHIFRRFAAILRLKLIDIEQRFITIVAESARSAKFLHY